MCNTLRNLGFDHRRIYAMKYHHFSPFFGLHDRDVFPTGGGQAAC